jgi:mono/diheme cytochrome c family protein
MSHKSVTTLAIAALSFTTACSLPFVLDAEEVGERDTFRYKGECTSWLVSAKTGYKYCASPAIDFPAGAVSGPEFEGMDDGPTDLAALTERGEVIYDQYCKTCHQAEGQGTAGAFPPLAGSGEFYGDAQNHAKIIVFGLNGPIEVQGVSFNGAMAPHGHLTDYDIASVATYERHSWGNNDGIVLPTDVAAVR